MLISCLSHALAMFLFREMRGICFPEAAGNGLQWKRCGLFASLSAGASTASTAADEVQVDEAYVR